MTGGRSGGAVDPGGGRISRHHRRWAGTADQLPQGPGAARVPRAGTRRSARPRIPRRAALGGLGPGTGPGEPAPGAGSPAQGAARRTRRGRALGCGIGVARPGARRVRPRTLPGDAAGGRTRRDGRAGADGGPVAWLRREIRGPRAVARAAAQPLSPAAHRGARAHGRAMRRHGRSRRTPGGAGAPAHARTGAGARPPRADGRARTARPLDGGAPSVQGLPRGAAT